MEIKNNENIVISNVTAGFGNQLFQYATGLAIAMKNKSKYKLDLSFYEKEENKKFLKLNCLNLTYEVAKPFEYLNYKNQEGLPSIYFRILRKIGIFNKFNKKTHIIDTLGFIPSKKLLRGTSPCYIEGYCTKIEYFEKIRPQLLEVFSLKGSFSKQASKILDKIKDSNSVSIHIRRGDYLGIDFFKIIPLEYYLTAINLISKKIENPEFFVFSDDIEWAKTNLKVSNKINFVNIDRDEDNTDIEEFFLMKNCKYNIIANSSFSWWASYLNDYERKIAIAPKKWYNNTSYQSSLEKHNIFLNDWIVLDY
jgi:hypothetical protein